MSKYDVVLIGASAGGLTVLEYILGNLSPEISTPIIIVQHLSPDSGSSITELLRKFSVIQLTEPIDKESILNNHVYIAPADYHILIEKDRSFALNQGPKENYCRPAIDILFETAAEVFFEKTIGVILTGANKDGTRGCVAVKKFSGLVVVQDPKEALIPVMPSAVIDAGCADYVLSAKEIVQLLNKVLKE